MTRKPTSNDPNAPMITVATAPDVPELHPLRWVIVDAGAGKTLAAAPTATAKVAGYDVANELDAVRRSIGLVFQEPTLDGYLTAEQNLNFHGDL